MGQIVGARDLATKYSPDELQEALRLQHEQAKAELATRQTNEAVLMR